MAPSPVMPWQSDAQLQDEFQYASQGGPLPPHYANPTYNLPRQKRPRGFTVEASLTPLDALCHLTDSLAVPPITVVEALQLIHRHLAADDSFGSAQPALPVLLQELFEVRGCDTVRVTRAALKERQNEFAASDLASGEGLILVDTERPLLVAAFPSEWRTRSGNDMLELNVPINAPIAFRRRVHKLKRISPHDCVVLRVSKRRSMGQTETEHPEALLEDLLSSIAWCDRLPGLRDAILSDPFCIIPVASARDKRRHRKHVRQPWFIRLLEKGARVSLISQHRTLLTQAQEVDEI